MGRPSKFTAERRERFLTALLTGVFPETAARYAGWSPATLYRILAGTTPAHAEFHTEVRRVETELELRLVGTVTQAALNDPRLALALLERRFRDRWGRSAGLLVPAADGARVVAGSASSVVVEPGLIEAMVPALLEARIGPAASADSLRRVDRFSRRLDHDPDG